MSKINTKDVLDILKLIRANYENSYAFKTEEEAKVLVAFWYDSLKNYSKEYVFAAVKNAIKSSEFAPKISTILAEIKKLTEADEKTDVELWAELEEKFYPIYQATQYLQYDQYFKWASEKIKQIYEGLSNEIKMFVVNTSTLIELAELANRPNDDSIKFEKARFLKAMPELRTKQTIRIQSQQFLQLCKANGIKLIGG